MIGLDTTAIIDLFNGDERLIKKINELKENIVSTMVNYQEIFFGIDFSNENLADEEIYYDSFFDNIEVFELSSESAKEASKILWILRKGGDNIGNFDSMIAGIYITNGVNKIITRNTKHFSKIKNLKVISY